MTSWPLAAAFFLQYCNAPMLSPRPCCLFVVPLLLALGGCDSSTDTPLQLTAHLQLEPGSLDFGQTPMGGSRSLDVELVNRGQVPLNVKGQLKSAESAYTFEPTVLHLGIGQNRRLAVSFFPVERRDYVADLVFVDRDSGEQLGEVVLLGKGVVLDCDDQNPCTYEMFDPANGRCRYRPRRGSCSDGLRCTENDRCIDGVCLGRPVTCDDGVLCTRDVCEEPRGCLFLPQHQICATQDPCITALCDPQLGCSEQLAADGTLCGPFSCQQVSVCVAGQCDQSISPEGLPCEDGDPCSVGDTCRRGVCQAGNGNPGNQMISVPVEVALPATIDSGHFLSPWLIVSVHAPATGGLEILWTNMTHNTSMQYFRTRVDADGSHVSTRFLAKAVMARPLYIGDDLYVLLGQHEDLCQQGVCPVQTCDPVLLHFGPGEDQPSYRCLASKPGLVDQDIAHFGGEMFLAQVIRTGSSGSWNSRIEIEQLWPDTELSFVEYATDPGYPVEQNPIYNIQLGTIGAQPWLAFVEYRAVVTSSSCCQGEQCEGGQLPVHASVATVVKDLTDATQLPNRFLLGSPARQIFLADGSAGIGCHWTQPAAYDQQLSVCQTLDTVLCFKPNASPGALNMAYMHNEPEGDITAISPAELSGDFAVFINRPGGGLDLLTWTELYTAQIHPVPQPQGQSSDNFLASVMGLPFPPVATEVSGQGLVAATVTTSLKLVFFSVGCGVVVEPIAP